MFTTTTTADTTRRGKTHPPSKNRVWDFFEHTYSCAGENWQITQCSRLENQPPPTTTASGVLYYGYRYYSTELGRWINRDPLGDEAFLSDFFLRTTKVELSTYNRLDHLPDEGMSTISLIVKEFLLREEGLTAYRFVSNDPVIYIEYLGLAKGIKYGNYCGGGYCGGKELKKGESCDFTVDPVIGDGGMDATCKVHDKCYSEAEKLGGKKEKKAKVKCDKEMCDALKAMREDVWTMCEIWEDQGKELVYGKLYVFACHIKAP